MRCTVAMLGVVVLGMGVLPTSAASAEMNPPGESTSAVTDDGVAGGATEESAAAAPTPTGKAGLADLPVADAGDNEVRRPVVSVDIEQVTPGTQTVRSAFEYLIEYSCLSKLADCDGVVISVPFDQTTALAGGASPIADWRAELISTNEQLVASDRYWDDGKNPRQIKLKTKLGAGSSSSVRIKLHPERGYVADGTTWEILPTIAANNAETSAAPVAVSSTVTASARLSGSLTFTDLADHKDARIGTQVLLKGVLAMPFGVGETGGIFADPAKPFETVMIMPEGLDFVSSPQIPELASYDPLTRAFTFRPAHDADMASFVMLFQLGSDVEVGDEFTLRSTSVGTAIGADTELVADATATVTVVPNVLTSANRRWEVKGNGVPAYSRGFIAPSSESEELNFFNVSLEAQPRETVTELLIQLPCLSPRTPAAGSAWGVSVTCTQPLVNAKTLALEYWSDSKTVVSDAEPVDVTVTLTDGSTHVIQVGAEPVSLAQWEGKVVSAEASGVRLGPLDPSIEWWIDTPKAVFKLGASLEDTPELNDGDAIVADFAMTIVAADDPSESLTDHGSASGTFRRGALSSPIGTSLILTGWTWGDDSTEVRSNGQWSAPRGERYESRTAALLLPEGLKYRLPPRAKIEEVPDYQGTGRTLLRFFTSLVGTGLDGIYLEVDSRSLEPGLYNYEIFHGFRGFGTKSCEMEIWPGFEGQILDPSIPDIFVDGQSDAACRGEQQLLVRGAQTGQSITKEVRGDLDTLWIDAPGTTEVSADGTGSAEYRLRWANTGPTAIHDVAIYDVLPAPGDASSVGALTGLSRGSDFAVTYESVTAPPGYDVAYSESLTPCRPELGGDSTGCVDDWTSTAPGDLSAVRALRFTAQSPAPGGQIDEFLIGVSLPEFAEGEAALNTAAAGGRLESGRAIPSVESPFVGVGAELRDADISATKQSDVQDGSAVRAGDRVTYTLELRNDGGIPGEIAYDDRLAGILDDATLVAAPVVTGVTSVTAIAFDDRIEIRGALLPDDTAKVTYTVEVSEAAERGDHTLLNFLVAEGGETPAECSADDTMCTQHDVDGVSLVKRAEPASGSALVAGGTVSYTLELANDGRAAEVAAADLLVDVLDDAELVGEIVVEGEGVTAELVDDRIVLGGSLAPEAVVTVSYEVRVKDAGPGQSFQLNNWLLHSDEQVPEVCDPESGNCTTHPVAATLVMKTADPASGTHVAAGDAVTYTVTVRNPGNAEAEVDLVDHLGGVLDSAKLVGPPVVTGVELAALVEGEELGISGQLGAGDTATVTYTVEVLADTPIGAPARSLDNVVLRVGEPIPGSCAGLHNNCTTHPIATAGETEKPPVTKPPGTKPPGTKPPAGPGGLEVSGSGGPVGALLLGALGATLLGASLVRRRGAAANR